MVGMAKMLTFAVVMIIILQVLIAVATAKYEPGIVKLGFAKPIKQPTNPGFAKPIKPPTNPGSFKPIPKKN